MKLKNKAFTLVELIIVITILAILTTIGFVSFQSYTKNTRDSNRLATLRNIQNGLDVYFTKNNTLPQPENFITVSYSGENISYQGSFGDNNAALVGFSKTPLDPLDSNKYTYSTSVDLKKYQVLTLLEDYSNIAFGKLETYAADDYSNRIPKTLGNGIGILLGTGSERNKPINFNYNASTFTGVNIATNTGFVALVSDSKKFTGNDLVIIKNVGKSGFDSSLVLYWDMETNLKIGTGNYIKDISGVSGSNFLYGTGLTFTGGIRGNASRFFGSNSSLIGIDPINKDILTKEFTTFLTYKINNFDNSMNVGINSSFNKNNSAGIITLADDIGNSIGYGYTNGYGNINLSIVNNNTSKNNYIYNIISKKQEWVNIAIKYDGKKVYIYENGSLKFEKILSELGIANWCLPGLGTYSNDSTNDLNTAYAYESDITIDEFKLYNRALTNDEIKNISNQMR